LCIEGPDAAFDLGVVAVRIELESLEETDGQFAHAYTLEELSLEDDRVRLSEPARIRGHVVRDMSQIVLEGHVGAQTQVDCDRCLKTLAITIDTDFSLRYVTKEIYELLRAAELQAEDLTLSVFDGMGIDIDEVVREQVLLAVPSRVLCRENCKGFCSVCGADRNLVECQCESTEIDPRWATLENLRF
jgi:DUF177 domain-containing protein